jgi:hypothetical protein
VLPDDHLVKLLPEMSNRALFDCAAELLAKPYRSGVSILLMVASECRRRELLETEHALLVAAGDRMTQRWNDLDSGGYSPLHD